MFHLWTNDKRKNKTQEGPCSLHFGYIINTPTNLYPYAMYDSKIFYMFFYNLVNGKVKIFLERWDFFFFFFLYAYEKENKRSNIFYLF